MWSRRNASELTACPVEQGLLQHHLHLPRFVHRRHLFLLYKSGGINEVMLMQLTQRMETVAHYPNGEILGKLQSFQFLRRDFPVLGFQAPTIV